MQPFTTLTSIAAPLPDANVDTDIILPARFLLITSKTGLGRYAFYERRYAADGTAKPEFVLNQPAYAGAEILVAGDNFGCGSSREQAPWALADLGVRCIIATGFGEIFRSNCLKNGMLPIVVSADAHGRLMSDAIERRSLTVDLMAGAILRADGERIAFALDESKREALLNGWDEIDRIAVRHGAAIAAFEHKQQTQQPWLWASEQEPVNG